jgi:C-terminal processing protease CtpA/Prc
LQYNKTYYLVQSVEADSPAQQGDLHANDVIHSINHQTTTNMPHGVFVETVNANSDIDLTVQTLNAFLRANPPPVRNQQMAAAVAAAINNETDKRKGGVSKALGKLTSR